MAKAKKKTKPKREPKKSEPDPEPDPRDTAPTIAQNLRTLARKMDALNKRAARKLRIQADAIEKGES